MKKQLFFLLFSLSNCLLQAQCLTLGADLSYVTSIEENGGEYRDENNTIIDPFAYFASRNAQLIRLRLWHTPENKTNACGNAISSSNLTEVLAAAQRVKAAGMQLKIAVHYGDCFNDPSKQQMPTAWQNADAPALLDSIYQYTYAILTALEAQNTPPDIISIGNETTWGFVDATTTTDGFDWPFDAQKFNAGLDAVDDFNAANNRTIKKALHFTETSVAWAAALFEQQGITNYDILGLSYYPYFSPDIDLIDIGELIANLVATYDQEVMIFETGFAWTTQSGDSYGNFINNNGNLLDYPMTAEGQYDFLIDLATTVETNGGTGLLYWEPTWISSDLCDLWGQGSSYENVSFFDFNANHQALPAFDFFDFCSTSTNEQAPTKSILLLYPNPTKTGTIQLKTKLSLQHWTLLNTSGQAIYKGHFALASSTLELTIPRALQGVYFLVLVDEKGRRVVRKVVFY